MTLKSGAQVRAKVPKLNNCPYLYIPKNFTLGFKVQHHKGASNDPDYDTCVRCQNLFDIHALVILLWWQSIGLIILSILIKLLILNSSTCIVKIAAQVQMFIFSGLTDFDVVLVSLLYFILNTFICISILSFRQLIWLITLCKANMGIIGPSRLLFRLKVKGSKLYTPQSKIRRSRSVL